mmetsp:Transcript_9657/g.23796  ORF Transcript_9657/g.23796 Transcript_9657/m.23796 type:complete len:86 (+) Transcript_9657:23-280(+)
MSLNFIPFQNSKRKKNEIEETILARVKPLSTKRKKERNKEKRKRGRERSFFFERRRTKAFHVRQVNIRKASLLFHSWDLIFIRKT